MAPKKQQGTLLGFVEGSKATPLPQATNFEVPYTKSPIQCIRNAVDKTSPPALIFTHGAGGTLSAPGMVNFSNGFAAQSPMVSFQGTMNLKARTSMFLAVIKHQKVGKALGGRSMGARAAVLASQDTPETSALILASYPLVNEKGDVRDQILLDLRAEIDVLFISGDQDTMMDFERLQKLRKQMKAKTWLVTVTGADHGMTTKPKKATEKIGNLTGTIAERWLQEHDDEKTEAVIHWDDTTNKAVCSDWVTGDSTPLIEKQKLEKVQDDDEVINEGPRKKRKTTK